MLFVLLLQAASLPPVPAAPQAEAWVAIALSAIGAVVTIAVAFVRRGAATAARAVLEKQVKSLAAKVDALAAKVDAFEAKAGEHRDMIEDIDERVSSPEMGGRALDRRIADLERSIAEERRTREERREAQHRQEIELAKELTRMSENVKVLAHQVERLHGTSSGTSSVR